MNSLDKALQNIQTWQKAASANNIKQSYKLWRENGVWRSCIVDGGSKMNSYIIYKLCDEDCNRRWYLRDGVSPEEQDNPLNGVGYLGYNKDRLPNPDELVIVIGEDSAIKLCEMLKHAFYGTPEQHFYEEVE